MIIIAGTHRSGSSYLAGLLHECGVPMGPPESFLPADGANPRGYFEQSAIADLNSRIITGFHRTTSRAAAWACRAVYALCPGERAIGRRAARLDLEIRRTGDRFFGCVIKDPRFSLTYPHWCNRTKITGVAVVLRHPEASARSLVWRDTIPRRLAYRFWDYHVEHLLAWLQPTRTLFIDFDRLADFGGEADLRRLYDYFTPAVPEDVFVERGRSQFSAELRRWRATDDGDLPARTRGLWARVQTMHAANAAAFARGERLRPSPAAW